MAFVTVPRGLVVPLGREGSAGCYSKRLRPGTFERVMDARSGILLLWELTDLRPY